MKYIQNWFNHLSKLYIFMYIVICILSNVCMYVCMYLMYVCQNYIHATRNRLTFFSNTTFYRKSHDLIIVCNSMWGPINFKYKLYFKKELHFHYNNVYCLNFFFLWKLEIISPNSLFTQKNTLENFILHHRHKFYIQLRMYIFENGTEFLIN